MGKNEDSYPLVTVYMPTYNRVELLQRAVESVLNQSYKNIELIVVDDRSTDTTPAYLVEMSKKDNRFKFLINQTNSGACFSRNKALMSAKGDFITGLDDDDYFLPDRIISFLNSWYRITATNKDCIALYSNNFVKMTETTQTLIRKKTNCTKKELICANFIGNQIFTKTEYLRSIGGFDENMPIWQDLECWYRLLEFYNGVAYSTDAYDYVVDVSHPHERITTKQADSAVKAYNYICKTHKLTSNQKKILEMQLIPYTKNNPSLEAITRRLFFAPNLYNIRTTLSIVYHSLKNIIKK